MNNTMIAEHVSIVHEAIHQRLDRFPGHPLFLFAQRETDTIRNRLLSTKKMDKSFYDSLNIGLMCARELEASDPTFCTYVYNLLEEIRKEVTERQSEK